MSESSDLQKWKYKLQWACSKVGRGATFVRLETQREICPCLFDGLLAKKLNQFGECGI